MRCRWLLLALLLAPTTHAKTWSMAADIRAGRAAIVASHPLQARAAFSAALAHGDGNREDTYTAALGLGRSTVWLGDYPAAVAAFRLAHDRADDVAERQAADTGLAQALNAQDYPREAYALVAPFAKGQTRAMLELLRALQSLGWQDKSPAYLQATPPPSAGGYLVTHYRLLQDDMYYALASRVEGRFDYNHDSEHLDTWHVGTAMYSAFYSNGSLVQRWGAMVDTIRVADGQRVRWMNGVMALGQLRIADDQNLDLKLGMGRSGSWQYLQGAAGWALQTNDSFRVSVNAARAPILTNAAIEGRLIYNTYDLGVSLRPAAHWYVLPDYYRQTFSDGNHRDGGTLRILLSPYDIPGTAGAIGAELSTRIFHDSQPNRGVYFNPANYHAAQLGLIGIYSLNPRWKLRATTNVGRQTINGTSTNIYSVDATLEGRLPHNGRLEFRLGRSSAASDSNGGTGYWNNNLMLSISYPL